MKSQIKIYLLLWTLVNIISVTVSAQTAYPLVCRFDGVDSASWNVSSTSTRNIVVAKSFKRGTQPATAGVPDGYCSWMDRAMLPSEPNIIGQEVFGATRIFEINYKGTIQLVTAPTLWAAMSLTKGAEITFQAYQGTLPGIAVPVLILK